MAVKAAEAKCRICADRAIWACLGGNVFLCVLKGVIGSISGSLAVTADAVHSGADVLDSIVTLVAIRLGKKPPDRTHPYGHGKTEFIAGVFIGVVLLVGAACVIVAAAGHLLRGVARPRPHFIALAAAAISVAVNEVLFRYAMCAAKRVNSAAIEAEAWDNRADSLSSIPVFLGVLGAQFGFVWLDALAALLLGFLVGKIGCQVMGKNLQGLMDAPLHSDEIGRISKLVHAVRGVEGIGYLRTRGMGRHHLADLQILVDPTLTVEKSNTIADEVRNVLRREIDHLQDITIVCKPHAERQKR